MSFKSASKYENAGKYSYLNTPAKYEIINKNIRIGLHSSLVRRTLKRKKKLYCCFIDYQKAFDFIDRSSLWSKLIKQGITGNIFSVIKSLYSHIKVCVKHNGQLTDYFNSTSGLLQGEVMSPILFSLYVNDFEIHFVHENCPSVDIQLINLFLLMYADDTVIMSEAREGLQNMLDSLVSYTKKWNLTVNIDKTKTMVFRNGKKLRDDEIWTYTEQKKKGIILVM